VGASLRPPRDLPTRLFSTYKQTKSKNQWSALLLPLALLFGLDWNQLPKTIKWRRLVWPENRASTSFFCLAHKKAVLGQNAHDRRHRHHAKIPSQKFHDEFFFLPSFCNKKDKTMTDQVCCCRSSCESCFCRRTNHHC